MLTESLRRRRSNKFPSHLATNHKLIEPRRVDLKNHKRILGSSPEAFDVVIPLLALLPLGGCLISKLILLRAEHNCTDVNMLDLLIFAKD